RGQWRVVGGGAVLVDYLEGPRPSRNRRYCRGSDHFVARAARRPAQLGLPVLLAAGCDVDALRTVELRLPGRGRRLARLAAACSRGLAGANADHVRDCRRTPPDRIRSSLAPGFLRTPHRCGSAILPP